MIEMNQNAAENSKFPMPMGDSSQVHLVFTDSKKTFEVNVNPEPKKIVEVVRLQDGSQSFRVRWKDTWLHEQYIGAYPDLVNEFWDKQKDVLTQGEHTAGKGVDFEDINGDVSSEDNDSYAMHPFLLEVEAKEEKNNEQNNFIEKSTTLPEDGDGDDDDDDDNDDAISDDDDDDDENDDGNDDGDEHDFNFIEEEPNPHIPSQDDSSSGQTMDQSNNDELTSHSKGDNFINGAESREDCPNTTTCDTISHCNADKDMLESHCSVDKDMLESHCSADKDMLEPSVVLESTDIHEVMGKIAVTGEVSLTEMSRDMVSKVPTLLNGHGVSQKRKSAASLKRLGKKGKKKNHIKDEKKASKKKHIEDEEKENVEECTEDIMSTHMVGGDEGSCETSTCDPSSSTSEKREKFSYPENKGPCVCDICGKIISNKYGLREHQTVVHFKNGKFECQICGKRVTNKRALNLHMTSHSNERQFVCELCGSSHKTKGNLNYHVKTMHTMIKNFRCDICFKTFKVQAELKEHCFTVHANEGVITCIVCKKKLTTALSIYTHSVMHSGAREHECDICGYAFKTLTGLKEHKITHSEDKPIRQCPYCERKFFSRSQYNAHVMRHTADGSLITYKCPICDVKFQHKSSYNRHVIRHQPGGDLEFPKENPYLLLDESELPEGVCHKCRKHYSSKSGFYLHLKKCRDGIVQQFQCPYCERGCSNRCSLKRHIQRRHKTIDLEQQRITEEVMITKQEMDGVDPSHDGVLSSHDTIQYHASYFDHGYGNQITTVDASQLSAVDLQLLLDTGATQNENQTATHILSNVGQVTQLTQNGDTTQNLHILTESEAAQFAAQLTQHGVIVRSSDVSHDQGQEQHLIVGTTQIDGHTSQLLVSERQAAQLLANAQLAENAGLTLEGSERNDILRESAGVLQFNNRTAVIQIQHNDVLTTQQVLTISDQQLQDEPDIHLETHTLHNINNENIQVTELQRCSDIKMELQRCSDIKMECENNVVEQYIAEEQIVSSLSENVVEHTYQSITI